MEESKIAENDFVENTTDAIQEEQRTDPPESAEEPAVDKSPDANRKKLSDWLQAIRAGIERLAQELKPIAESSWKTAGEIREIHRLYHNEFANRLKSMQEELERYHEMEKGRTFDGILGEIAKLYSGNEPLVEEITDDKVNKRIRYMFMDMLQILEANGVSMLKSKPGDKRNTRHCQVVERIPTENPDLHDTVKLSRSTGFYVENRSLVKEFVDIYLFTGTNAGNPVEK
jgi:molecular chaperone GrpE (heat shock protein)